LLCVLAFGKKRKKLDTKHLFCCVLRTPNRRLLSRKTEFEFVRPYDLIPKYLLAVAEKAQEGRAFCEARPAEGGASEQTLSPENLKCLDWSGCRESNSVYTHPMGMYYRYTTARNIILILSYFLEPAN